MSASHCGLSCLLRMLTCFSSAGSQLLVLLLVSVMVSYASAQQPNQRPRSERHLDPSGFPWPNGAKMALSLTFDHRLIDGGPAARFLATLREFVQAPRAAITRAAG